MDHFGPKKNASLLIWINTNISLDILHNENSQEVNENHVHGLLNKLTFGANRLF